ncbi:MAG: hypothetical protein WCH61_05200, partial [bacterium]
RAANEATAGSESDRSKRIYFSSYLTSKISRKTVMIFIFPQRRGGAEKPPSQNIAMIPDYFSPRLCASAGDNS